MWARIPPTEPRRHSVQVGQSTEVRHVFASPKQNQTLPGPPGCRLTRTRTPRPLTQSQPCLRFYIQVHPPENLLSYHSPVHFHIYIHDRKIRKQKTNRISQCCQSPRFLGHGSVSFFCDFWIIIIIASFLSLLSPLSLLLLLLHLIPYSVSL